MTLPNSNCELTKQDEINFFKSNVYFTELKDRLIENGVSHTVIFSRVLKKKFKKVNDNRNNSFLSSLKVFKNFGHSLSLNYDRLYVRNFALDVDCSHRKINADANHESLKNFQHVNEGMINELIGKIREVINTYGVFDDFELQIKCWQLNCGFHVYTNFPVSLPTHFQLLEEIKSKTSIDNTYILEIPSQMPLPFSAKTRGEPYREMCYDDDSKFDLLPNSSNYYELFTTSHTEIDGETMCKIIKNYGHIEYWNKRDKFIVKKQIPSFKDLTSITVYENWDCALPLKLYAQLFRVNTENDSRNEDDYIMSVETSINDLIENIKIYSPDIATKTINILKSDNFLLFLKNFCVTHTNKRYQQSPDGYADFYNASINEHEGLDLQHYAIALQMTLHLNAKIFSKYVLKPLFEFSENMIGFPITNEVTKRFVNNYHDYITESYCCTPLEILAEMAFCRDKNLNPFLTIEEKVTNLLRSAMNDTSPEEHFEDFSRANTSMKYIMLDHLFPKYFEIILKLKIFVYHANVWYVLKNSGSYVMCMKFDDKFVGLDKWVNTDRKTISQAIIKLNISENQATVPHMWSNSKVIFATTLGPFNSVTGLYLSGTSLLRFNIYRNSSVFPLFTPQKLYPKINRDVVAFSNKLRPYIDTLYNDMTNIFIATQLVPTLLQLRSAPFIEEIRIVKLFDLLKNHKSDFSEAYFIMEYFPINPKIIYVIAKWLKEFNFTPLFSCSALTSVLLKVPEDAWEGSVEQWEFKINAIINNIYYDKMEEISDSRAPISPITKLPIYGKYVASLLSLKSRNDLINLDIKLLFLAVICGVCFYKCRNYKNLIKAFENAVESKTDSLPDLSLEQFLFVAMHVDNKPNLFLNYFNKISATDSEMEINSDEDDNSDEETDFLNQKRYLLEIIRKKFPFVSFNVLNEIELILLKKAYKNLNIRTEVKTCAKFFDKAAKKLFPFDSSNPIDVELINIIFQLCLWSTFNVVTLKELIGVGSHIYLTFNFKKKILMLYGPAHTGKSHFTTMCARIVAPAETSTSDIETINNRQNSAGLSHLIVLNDVIRLKASVIKALSGNDGSTAMIFYSQTKVSLENRAVVMGAANQDIEFGTGGQNNVDKVTVERVHGVLLKGQQMAAQNYESLLYMLTENIYFQNTITKSSLNYQSLAWILFESYFKYRGVDLHPVIDVNNENVKDYQHKLHIRNNKIYNFLNELGVTPYPQMQLLTEKFVHVVKNAIKKGDCVYKKFATFRNQLLMEGVDKDVFNKKTIENFIFIKDLQKIQMFMRTITDSHSCLSANDIFERAKNFKGINRDNAAIFVKQENNSRYDSAKQVYANVKFEGSRLTEFLCDNDKPSNEDCNDDNDDEDEDDDSIEDNTCATITSSNSTKHSLDDSLDDSNSNNKKFKF